MPSSTTCRFRFTGRAGFFRKEFLKKNSLIQNLSLAAISILALFTVFFLIEFFAGMVFSDVKVFYKLHPKYLYTTKSDFKRKIFNKRTGEEIFFRTSALGYRGKYVLEKSRPRVVVYGDSNVQALIQREEDTFPFRLEKILESKGQDFEVINAGTSGYGADQNLLRAQDEIPLLMPDVIVFQIFADNDFGDLIRNKIFEIKNKELVKRNPKLSFAVRSEYFCATSYICRSIKKSLQRRARKPRIDLLRLCEMEFESYKRDNVVDFPMWEDHFDADIHFLPAADSSKKKIALMKLLVKELKKINAQYPDTQVMLLIQPAKDDLLSGNKKQPLMVEVLEKAAEESGLDYINLYPGFVEAGAQQVVNDYDNHWSPGGQVIAANLAANKIISFQKQKPASA